MSEKVILSTDGGRRLRVLQRCDGNFSVWEETLLYDDEEGLSYWSKQMHALPGIYISAEAAFLEIRTWPGFRSAGR